MKDHNKHPLFINSLVLAILFLLFPFKAYGAEQERIIFFDSDVVVQEDASLLVTETIKVYAAGDEIKRGIYRDFPTKYKDERGIRYNTTFDLINVLKDGRRENSFVENIQNGKRLYIGESDVYLDPGEYVYKITYRTQRQLGFFEDHDELYWNVTGNGWNFAIEQASARVTLPDGIKAASIQLEGYTGPQGGKDKNFTASIDGGDHPFFTTTTGLQKNEGLTIVVSWPKDFVKEPTDAEKQAYLLQDNRSLIVAAIGLIVFVLYYIVAWFMVGRDPRKGTVIPLYESPENLSPAALRYISRMKYDNRIFAASLISMAIKKYLIIKENDKIFTLEKIGTNESSLSTEEKELAHHLFQNKKSIRLANTSHTTISTAMQALKASLKKQFYKKYFYNNTGYFIIGLLISSVVTVTSLSSEDLGEDALGLALWITVWTVGISFLLKMVVTLWKQAARGQHRSRSLAAALFTTLFALPFVAAEIFVIVIFSQFTSVWLVIIPLIMIFCNFLFYTLLKKPTPPGRKLMDQIEGFKMYLSIAEKDRLNFHNPPEKTPEIFENFLPFALALGVEQLWSQYFSDVLQKIRAEGQSNGYSPVWYVGPAFSHGNFSGFVSGIGGSLTSSIASSSHAPGSSSGSGGGGSSGGGGGGGGGGGW